ncbi:hypothetical protein BOTCAL_0394g00010 [Botryotinia calthae]|uniref:thioredoxin-dependent peroxiredoxin n=1 Tax=Botryotinia calthae TaxID=38488 RepID=A0A4Y8CRH3_9HELO|nr:hypothetical protein BOTCAL_0394g00010 [Botryotinia calthae]
MPVTLRKRPAPAEPPAPAPPAKKKSTVAKTVAKVKEPVKKAAEPKATKATKAAPASKTNGSKAKTETKVEAPAPLPQVKASKASAPAPAPAPASAPVATTKAVVGETIDLKGFGGEIETNEGEKTTLEKLVSESKSGVVLFTYPKASTPGCTNQVCAFRDSHPNILLTGYTVYGLSKDSPKSNTTFKTNQKLPYTLLCDTKSTLISAIGLKNAKGTTRGVFVIDKSGKVLAAQAGSPKGTLEVVEGLIGVEKEEVAKEEAATGEGKEAEKENEKETTAEETKEEASPTSEEKQTEEPTTPETNGINGADSSAAKEDVAKAEVAADVADTAEKLDGKDSEVKAAETSTA